MAVPDDPQGRHHGSLYGFCQIMGGAVCLELLTLAGRPEGSPRLHLCGREHPRGGVRGDTERRAVLPSLVGSCWSEGAGAARTERAGNAVSGTAATNRLP